MDELTDIWDQRAVAVEDPLGDLIRDDMMLDQLVPKGDASAFQDIVVVDDILCGVNIDKQLLLSSQEHKKAVSRAKEQSLTLRTAMVATGHVKNDGKVVKKKTKVVSDVLTGKRVLDLSIANHFLPPKSFFHEATDGLRLRIFYARQRWSTSGLL